MLRSSTCSCRNTCDTTIHHLPLFCRTAGICISSSHSFALTTLTIMPDRSGAEVSKKDPRNSNLHDEFLVLGHPVFQIINTTSPDRHDMCYFLASANISDKRKFCGQLADAWTKPILIIYTKSSHKRAFVHAQLVLEPNWHLEFAVGVQQCPLTFGARTWNPAKFHHLFIHGFRPQFDNKFARKSQPEKKTPQPNKSKKGKWDTASTP